jgi:rhodanese-related sulfurtransferase
MKLFVAQKGTRAMTTPKQFVLIAILGLVLGFGMNIFRSVPLAWTAEPEIETVAAGADTLTAGDTFQLAIIGFEECDAIYRKELGVFVDARLAEDYSAGHIPGAVSIPVEEYRDGNAKLYAPKGSLVVVYCSDLSCDMSEELAGLLVKNGFRKVRIYPGGMEEWDSFGQPVSLDEE